MTIIPDPTHRDLSGGPDASATTMPPASIEPVLAVPAPTTPMPVDCLVVPATPASTTSDATRTAPATSDPTSTTPATSDATMSDADFEPVQIIRVDLAEPLQAIVRQLARSGSHYTRGRVLVLLHGISLGTVWVDLPGERIAVDRLAELVLDELGSEIRAHLVADGAGPVECEVDVRRLAGGLARPCAYVTEVLPGAKASVVLATCGRPTSLWLALEALLCSDHPDFEIIVVDNSPEDPRTRRLIAEHFASEPRVRLVPEPQRGLSHARNRGLVSARADVVAFTDDDVVVSPTWLSRLAAEFVPGVACVTGLVEPIELETVCQWWFECAAGFGRGRERQRYHLTDAPDESPLFPYKLGCYGTGASMALSKRELPGWTFDTALGAGSPAAGGEDLDLFLDVLMNGRSLVYQPAALSFHRHRATADELEKQMSGYGRGLTGVLSKRLLRRPAERRLLATKVLAGVRHAISPQFRTESEEEVPASPYPRSMLVREVLGMAQGPLAYLVGARRSRRVARACRPWNDALHL